MTVLLLDLRVYYTNLQFSNFVQLNFTDTKYQKSAAIQQCTSLSYVNVNIVNVNVCFARVYQYQLFWIKKIGTKDSVILLFIHVKK